MRIGRFIEDIVPRDPWVVFITLSNVLPDEEEAILEIFVPPEIGEVGSGVCVPSAALSARGCMHVDDGVDRMCSTGGNCTIQMLKGVGFHDPRVHVICVMFHEQLSKAP